MSTEITTLNKTGEVFDIDVTTYNDKQFESLHVIARLRATYKRGKELEDHLMDIYSDQLHKQKQQMEHQLYLGLDTAKKKSYEEYLTNIKEIENNMTRTMNDMTDANAKIASQHLQKLFDFCDAEQEAALQYKVSHPERYKKLLEKISETEMQGWEVIEERKNMLLDKHRELFATTIKLFKDETDALI